MPEFNSGEEVLQIWECSLEVRKFVPELEDGADVIRVDVRGLEGLEDVEALEGGGNLRGEDASEVGVAVLREVDVFFTRQSNRGGAESIRES